MLAYIQTYQDYESIYACIKSLSILSSEEGPLNNPSWNGLSQDNNLDHEGSSLIIGDFEP